MSWIGYGFAFYIWVCSLVAILAAMAGLSEGEDNAYAVLLVALLVFCLSTAWWVEVSL